MSRVLVVDDSPTQASEICFLLEEAGFDLDLAADGMEALVTLQQQLPDIIVTDLQRQQLDDLSLVESIKKNHSSVPIVLITSNGSEEIATRALQCGAASYVPRQYLVRDLAEVVAQIVGMAAPDPDQERINECLEEARLRFVLDNEISLVPPLIHHVEHLLLQMRFCDRTDLIRLAVALREAIVNAIDHGNLELDSELRQDDEGNYRRLREERLGQSPYRERRVHFDLAVTRGHARFTIRDEGRGFDPLALPDPCDPANLGRIGGRGLLLIRALMDEVTYNATGNEISLVKRRRK